MTVTQHNAAPEPSATTSLTVHLGDRSYDIIAAAGLIDQAGSLMKGALKQPRVIVITDSNVAPLWLNRLMDSLSASGIRADAIVVPAGEQSKSFGRLEQLCEDILALKAERKTTLVALGGGVIGDLTGFVAAVVLRGMDFIQIPTTVLAQVDSSVGGKTGINTAHGKNLVGAFHQPRLVLIDIDSLETLPKREFLAGYAEVVKYALINDPAFFDWLEQHGPDLINGDKALQTEAILHCCQAKADVVAKDEKESGLRALLNLGHTFGHAIEAECGYGGKVLHGEAVAIGMIMAFDLSVELGLCPATDLQRLKDHCQKTGLPTGLAGLTDSNWRAEKLVDHMKQDKKVDDGKITFVMARGIGQSFLTNDISLDQVTALMTRYLEEV